jgi:hypothetical protein
MRRIARWLVIVLLAVVGVWLLLARSRDLLLLVQPEFLVLEVHSPTMVLQQANRRYVVRCEERCRIFVMGRGYRLRKRGGALEYRRKAETIVLPILEEQIFFTTQPGGLGGMTRPARSSLC